MRTDDDHLKTRRDCAVLIASDRAASGDRQDETIPLLEGRLIALDFNVTHTAIVPDDRSRIADKLNGWVEAGVALIIVSGGTGVAPSDVTPEATLVVIERRIPGMEEAMRRASHDKTPFAMLSRGVVGIARGSLIVDLPGSPKGAVENLNVIAPALDHAIELIQGGKPDK
jgi:molybdenum cofactor synthesis domain-containing protein